MDITHSLYYLCLYIDTTLKDFTYKNEQINLLFSFCSASRLVLLWYPGLTFLTAQQTAL